MSIVPVEELSPELAIAFLMADEQHPGELNSEFIDRQRQKKKFLERLQNADPESIPESLRKYVLPD